MVVWFGVAVRGVAALLLLYAALHKLAAPSSFRRSLTALRMPAAEVFVVLVPMVEIAVAVGLLVAPRSVFTAIGVGGLGVAFAVAGGVAMRRGDRIRCACFGQAGGAELGPRQLVALPAWLSVVAISLLVSDGAVSGIPMVVTAALSVAVLVMVRDLLALASRNRAYLKVVEEQARHRVQGAQ